MTSAADLPLASDFPQASYDDWRRLVDGALKGAPFEKLIAKTDDGLKIGPIWRRARDAARIDGRAAAAPWQIMQRIDHPDPAKANKIALHELQNGASGLEIDFAGGAGARGFGVINAAPETLKTLFDGVRFDAGIFIALNESGSGNAGEALAALIESERLDPARVEVRFNYQAISAMAVRGSASSAWREMEKPFARAVGGLMSRGFRGPFVLADGRPVHDAGGSQAQELAFALSLALTYLRALEKGGVALEAARNALSFRLVADADQFLTIAKLRSIRLLWARIEQACGLAPEPVFVAAETAWRMLTQRDPFVNMLRATVATFSAGLAGANAVTVLPHTLALGLPDSFARRVARNTQLVLLEEASLARVSDPAAGSGGIEALTEELCSCAWDLFQEIERAGGILAALQKGLLQERIARTRRAREESIARRKELLTGATEFPDLGEGEVAVDDQKPLALAGPGTEAVQIEPLSPVRLAAPFERLRDRSDQILKEKGKRPTIFLGNLGQPSDFTARASFARSFFESGGIEAIASEGLVDASTVAAACKASGADLVCLCSSDKIYAAQAADAARALHAAGSTHIYLAGRPGELEAPLRAAGVETFIFAGGDALAVLQDAYRHMERP